MLKYDCFFQITLRLCLIYTFLCGDGHYFKRCSIKRRKLESNANVDTVGITTPPFFIFLRRFYNEICRFTVAKQNNCLNVMLKGK